MKPKRLSDDEVQTIVTNAIQAATSFIEAEIAPGRLKAQRYYDGRVDVPVDEGRSRVVATKARDVVRAIKPSLMRVFLQTDKPVEFIPRGPDDVPGAEQATSYINWQFAENNGYRLLNSVFHDALVKRVGIARVHWEESEVIDAEEYQDLTDDAFALILGDDEIQVTNHTARVENFDGIDVTFHDMRVERRKKGGSLKLDALPPENFFVDDGARSIDDCVCCGHSAEVTVSDLVALGVSFDVAAELDAEAKNQEDVERRSYYGGSESVDRSMKKVLATEAYIKIDIEGRGIAQTYKFLCGGTKHKVLSEPELCSEAPFAIFEIDPEPHAFFGRSLVDMVIEDTDAATVLLRGLLDNVIATNNPGTEAVVGQVEMDDLLNNEFGRIIRVKQIGATREITVPLTAGAVLPAMDYFDQQIEAKTGVTRSSMGLNPEALQAATATAVQATVAGASGQAEIIARNLAEGGMKRLFKLMLKLTVQHVSAETHMRLNGAFVPVDPRSWNATMDLTANVGLGTGQHEEKAMVLREIFQTQSTIWQAYGNGNGLVSLSNIRNTLSDIAKHSGIANTDRYYAQMTPEIERQMQEQAAAQAAQNPAPQDPSSLIAQAEMMKAQARMAEAETKLQIAVEGKVLDDDLERDKMAQDAVFKAAELLGNYGVRVDLDQLREVQAQ